VNRLQPIWVERPDEDAEETERSITFRLTDDWVMTDADQLLLPIRLLERNGEPVNGGDGAHGILKQYGGEGLLNSMLMEGQDMEPGTHWCISYSADLGFQAFEVPTAVDDGDDGDD